MKKTLLLSLAGMVIAAGGGLGWLLLRKPAAAPPSSIRVPMTPERIARGKYLFEAVADCDGCHSERDFSRFGGPIVPSGRGKGFRFPDAMGLPGSVVASNITPDPETGIGAWTDGEKIRAIREGVSRDGRALFPMMGYPRFRRMSDEDVESLVAFLNTLKPVRNSLTKTKLAFPVSVLVNSEPRPVGSVPAPDRSNPVRYGEYMATLAGCVECHTPMVNGRPDMARLLAGGETFQFSPTLIAVSANISPDGETGIGAWSEQRFLDTFYRYRAYAEKEPPKVGPERFTVMPWLGLTRMKEDDLKAIFAYLRTFQPVRNAVAAHPLMAAR